MALYDQAIVIHERLVNQEGRWELANDLAGLYMDNAAALRDLGDTRGVLALYDQALMIRERLVNQEGRWELAMAWRLLTDTRPARSGIWATIAGRWRSTIRRLRLASGW